MFDKKKDNDLGTIETILGADTVFQGTIRSKTALRIDGKLEGGVAEASGVIIGEKGQVQGDVNARVVIIGGKITGNITATHNLEILPKAQVYGDIHTSVLSIGEGSVFEGNCVMSTDKNKVIEMDIDSAPVSRRH